MNELTHEHARQLLHHHSHELSASDRATLDAHLAQCAECRAYAHNLAMLQPVLAQAMRARWDAARPPLTTYRSHQKTPPIKLAPRWAFIAALGALALIAVFTAPLWLVPAPASAPTVPILLTPAPPTLPGVVALESAGDIFIIRAEGAEVMHLIQAPYEDTAPAWSPDGLRLAFISDRTGRPEVYVQALDSDEATRLTSDPDVEDYYPPIAWSPDGAQLAVTVKWKTPVNGQPTQIYLIPLTGGTQAGALRWNRDTNEGHEMPHYGERAPAWSPDGKQLAFIIRSIANNERIAIANFDAPFSRTLTEDNWLDETAFAWSPDGRQIAFISLGPGEGGAYVAQLSLSALDGNAPRIILTQTVPSAPVYQHLRWSPEGARLLFTAADAKGVEQMYLLYSDGSSLTHLGAGAAPQFSPDGHWIIYEHGGAVFALNVDDAFRAPASLAPVRLMEGTAAQWQTSSSAPVMAVIPPTPAPSADVLHLLGVHSVQEGESARCIASAYGVSLDALIAVNQLGEPPQLPSGALLIPSTPDTEAISSRYCAPQFTTPGALDAPVAVSAFDPLPFTLSPTGIALNTNDCALTGRVLSRAGVPLAGMLVHVEGNGLETERITGDSGFAFPLTGAGAYRVWLVNPNGLPLSDEVAVEVTCGATIDFIAKP